MRVPDGDPVRRRDRHGGDRVAHHRRHGPDAHAAVHRTAGAGSLELYGYDSTGTQLFDSGSIGGFAANGKQLLIAIALQNAGGGNITWHVDGWAPGAASPAGLSGSISGTIGAVTRVALNRDGTLTGTVMGHCAVLTAYQQLYNLFHDHHP